MKRLKIQSKKMKKPTQQFHKIGNITIKWYNNANYILKREIKNQKRKASVIYEKGKHLVENEDVILLIGEKHHAEK